MKMPSFVILPKPNDPALHIEPALDCDGTDCLRVWLDFDGEPVPLPAHFHLVESEPGCVTMVHAIGGELPPDNYIELVHDHD